MRSPRSDGEPLMVNLTIMGSNLVPRVHRNEVVKESGKFRIPPGRSCREGFLKGVAYSHYALIWRIGFFPGSSRERSVL